MCVFKDISAEIEKLTEIACGKGVEVQIITPEKIVISQWVRFKCRYGCKGYGKHFGCPPYAPSPDETRRMVDEYSTGLLLRFDGVPGRGTFGPEDIPDDFHDWFRDLILWVNGTVHMLEKTAFYDGFYKAFGFGGYPCIYCEHQHCVAEEATGSGGRKHAPEVPAYGSGTPEYGGGGYGRVRNCKKCWLEP